MAEVLLCGKVYQAGVQGCLWWVTRLAYHAVGNQAVCHISNLGFRAQVFNYDQRAIGGCVYQAGLPGRALLGHTIKYLTMTETFKYLQVYRLNFYSKAMTKS